jgi:H+/Cl- antiporter ClcA
LDSGENAPWYYASGKFFGAIASVSAGVPGGYFSTALSIGAGVGDLIHHIIPSVPLAQFYLLGMAGFLAAITQSPITAVAMVVEMSDSSQFSLPILLSCFVASLIAEQFGDSVYHQQVLNYIDPKRYKETL